jgi:hypothetical protein
MGERTHDQRDKYQVNYSINYSSIHRIPSNVITIKWIFVKTYAIR